MRSRRFAVNPRIQEEIIHAAPDGIQALFTQSDCYKAFATSRLVGVQVHSTGANNPYLRRYVQPDDGRLGLNKNGNSHNRPGVDVCANAYIGKLMDGTVAVYQTLPWDVRCWISGKAYFN